MSIRVSGSDKRMSLRLPAEGQGWARQGDEMIPVDLGGGGAQLLTIQGAAAGNSVNVRVMLPAGHIGPCRLMLDSNHYGGDGDGGTGRTFTITNFTDMLLFDTAQDPVVVAADNNDVPSFKAFDPDMTLGSADNVMDFELSRAGGSGGCSFVLVMEFTAA